MSGMGVSGGREMSGGERIIRLTSQTGIEQITQFLTFAPLMWVFSEQTRDVRASSSDQYSGDCRSVSRTVLDVRES